jgi:deoxyribodipyrimidine photo-lyase
MSRDQRTADNWALLFAQELALQRKAPLIVVFCLVSSYLRASNQHFKFMTDGLKLCESKLLKKQIPFVLVKGKPEQAIPIFIEKNGIGTLVCDFSPLKINRQWKARVNRSIEIPFYEVDAHNIVPCWVASQKAEYAARTFRPKIHRALKEFLQEFPLLKKHPHPAGLKISNSWKDIGAQEIHSYFPQSGEDAALREMGRFLRHRLASYGKNRNDPAVPGQSNLSPYLHFGQISGQRVALEVRRKPKSFSSSAVFLEELVVRRELSDNFCYYNRRYDSFDGFPDWAKSTLNKHRKDTRPYLYNRKELERAKTHDDLWNAAQMEMVLTGKMHGYLRMYWAKKILEWTPSPEIALKTAIYLNDKYELDGRDPNGYTGIAWSIGGVHDRPWFERSVFGTIRYMSHNGCKKKFDVRAYVNRMNNLNSSIR